MSFIYELKNYPLRTVKTALLGLLFIGLGLFIAAVGPALLDLQLLAGTTIKEIAFILPARSFGYAIGSVIGGIVGDRMDHQLLIIISIAASVVTMFLFPMFANITVMYVLMMLSGVSNGCIDTVGNCWLIHIWGKENPPFMQIIHFMYGLGAFIAPFLVEPFLLNKIEDFPQDLPAANRMSLNLLGDNSSTTEIPPTTTQLSTVTAEPQLVGTADELKIAWPFIITAIYYLFVLALFLFVYIFYPDNAVHPSRLKKDTDEIDENARKDKYRLNNPVQGGLRTFIITVATLSIHAYVGLEISFGSLLSPFAVKSNLHMSKSEGSFLTSSYWATYTFLRVFSLIAIIYFSPRTLLLVNFAIIMFSNVILVPFANTYRWALWLGSALMGLGCSSVFATMFAFLGFLVAACAGEFIIPYIVASYIEHTPQVFLWVVLLYSTVSFIGVLGLFFLQNNLLNKQHKEQVNLRTHSNEMVTLDTCKLTELDAQYRTTNDTSTISCISNRHLDSKGRTNGKNSRD